MNRKFVLLSLLGLFLLGLTACQRTQAPTLEGVNIDSSALEETVSIDDFDVTVIELILHYSDGSEERITLTQSMILDADLEKLSAVGNHTITVSYQGFSDTFTITLTPSQSALDMQLLTIYELGVSTGVIEGTYEDWLESIKGDDGIGIASATINASGDLIITKTNGQTINAGSVVGISIVDVYVDEDYNVMVKFSDGSTVEAGNVAPEYPLSAYELYCLYNPWYEGDEMQWIHDLAHGNLVPEFNMQDPEYPDLAMPLNEALTDNTSDWIVVAGLVVATSYYTVLIERDGYYLHAYVGWHNYEYGDAVQLEGHMYTSGNFILDAYNHQVLSENHLVSIESEATTIEDLHRIETNNDPDYYGRFVRVSGAVINDYGRIAIQQGEHKIYLSEGSLSTGESLYPYVGDYVDVELHYLGKDWDNYPIGFFNASMHEVEVIEGDDLVFVMQDAQRLQNRTFETIGNSIDLPTAELHDTTIEWTSLNPDIIDNDGFILSMPEETTMVTFEATVRRGEAEHTVTIEATIQIVSLREIASLTQSDEGTVVYLEGVIYYVSDQYVLIYDGTGYLRLNRWTFRHYELGDTIYVIGYYGNHAGDTIYDVLDHAISDNVYAMPIFDDTTYTMNELFQRDDIQAGMIVRVQGYMDYGSPWDMIFYLDNYEVYVITRGIDFSEYTHQVVEFEFIITHQYINYWGWIEGEYVGEYEDLTLADMDEFYGSSDVATLTSQTWHSYGETFSFPQEGHYGTNFSYTSLSPDIVSDDGTILTMPEQTTDITFEVTASYGDFTETFTITVTIVIIEQLAIDAISESLLDQRVIIEGVIYDYIHMDYNQVILFIADGTGTIAIQAYGNNDMAIGNNIRVHGSVGHNGWMLIINDVTSIDELDDLYTAPEHAGYYTLDDIVNTPPAIHSRITLNAEFEWASGNLMHLFNETYSTSAILFVEGNAIQSLYFYGGLDVELEVIFVGFDHNGTMCFMYTHSSSMTAATEEAMFMHDINQVMFYMEIVEQAFFTYEGKYGTAFTYTSLHPEIIDDSGYIINPPSTSMYVDFYVVATRGELATDFTIEVYILVETIHQLGMVTDGTSGGFEGVIIGTIGLNYFLLYDETGSALVAHNGEQRVRVGDRVYVSGVAEDYSSQVTFIGANSVFMSTTVYNMPEHQGTYTFEAYIDSNLWLGDVFELRGEFVFSYVECSPYSDFCMYELNHVLNEVDYNIVIVSETPIDDVVIGETIYLELNLYIYMLDPIDNDLGFIIIPDFEE